MSCFSLDVDFGASRIVFDQCAMANVFDLPVASVNRIIKNATNSLPSNVQISREVKTAFSKAAGLFILYITSAANEFCTNARRTTLTNDDIYAALSECEFESFVPLVDDYLRQYRQQYGKSTDVAEAVAPPSASTGKAKAKSAATKSSAKSSAKKKGGAKRSASAKSPAARKVASKMTLTPPTQSRSIKRRRTDSEQQTNDITAQDDTTNTTSAAADSAMNDVDSVAADV